MMVVVWINLKQSLGEGAYMYGNPTNESLAANHGRPSRGGHGERQTSQGPQQPTLATCVNTGVIIAEF